MDNDEDPIDRALGINPMVPDTIKDTVATIVSKLHDDSATEDFTFARANIREILSSGTNAFSRLSDIADQSQNPRAYEVLGKLMDSMVNASEKLLEIQQKIREIDDADRPRDEQAKNVTNNLFVGSTAELQKVLDTMKKQ